MLTWHRLQKSPSPPPHTTMSLSRLEKDAVAAEEARVQALRARAARALKDEEQLKRKDEEENKAHLRYCFKGAPKDNSCSASRQRCWARGKGRRRWRW